MKKCDICGSEITGGKCSCGTWFSKEETSGHPLEQALKFFHDEKRMILTCDIPYLGCAAVFFRGDYKDCKKVEEFICKLKGRPFYNESAAVED